jgi:hypothetical protein
VLTLVCHQIGGLAKSDAMIKTQDFVNKMSMPMPMLQFPLATSARQPTL